MNKFKANSRSLRLLAFLLIATILLCIVGFSADGWQSMTNVNNNNAGVVHISSGNNYQSSQIEPQKKYYDYLTGKVVTQEAYLLKKSAFVISSDAPIYGVYSSDLLIELPTEKESRYLVFTDCINTLGKIGSIAPTRAYITSILNSFGGILLAYGTDGSRTIIQNTDFFDLQKNTGYSYTEYSEYVYSNHDLIKAGIINSGISVYNTQSPTLPYEITSESSFCQSASLSAQSVSLSFSPGTKTELIYSKENGTYVYHRNGVAKTDLLVDKALSYNNVFVLFADSVTYETEGGTELILDTSGGGRGYYIRDGYAQEITWASDADGQLVFKNKSGEKLTVGTGNSYIGFMKSSQISAFKLQ